MTHKHRLNAFVIQLAPGVGGGGEGRSGGGGGEGRGGGEEPGGGGGEGLQPVQAASQSSGAPTLSGLGVGGKGSTSSQSRPIHLVRGIVLP